MNVLSRTRPARFRQKQTNTFIASALGILCALACEDDCRSIGEGGGVICGSSVATADIESTFSLPVIAAKLGDLSIHLLIDTGAETTIFSSTLLKRPDASSFRLETPLCIGEGFCLEQLPVYAWNTAFSTPEPDGINGVLGMDLLRHFTVGIHSGITIDLHFESGGCDGVSVPLKYTSWGTPVADVRFDNVLIENVLLDTGAAVCLLDDPTANLLDPYFKENATETTGCTITGCVDEGVFQSTAARLCIDSYCLLAVETKFPAWNAVGDSYFFAYDLAFDFNRDVLVYCGATTSP